MKSSFPLTKTLALSCVLFGVTSAHAGLTHRYSFDADASDSVGSADGTLFGDAIVSGGSVSFDGTGDYVTFDGSAIGINGYSEVSLELWFTASATNDSGNDMIAAFGTSGGSDGFDYFIVNSLSAASRTTITDNKWDKEVNVEATSWNDGSEHHVVATVDATNISLYVDGGFIGSTALTSQSIGGLSNDFAYLAKSVYSGDPDWTGSVNEYRIWDNALTLADVESNYASGPSVIPEPSTYALLFGFCALSWVAIRRRKA